MNIGVLALQGDVREHARVLTGLGADVALVRRPAELAAVDGLVLPGGESTTIAKLAERFGLMAPLRAAAIVQATTFHDDPDVIAKVSRGLGEAMVGLNVSTLPADQRFATRGW